MAIGDALDEYILRPLLRPPSSSPRRRTSSFTRKSAVVAERGLDSRSPTQAFEDKLRGNDVALFMRLAQDSANWTRRLAFVLIRSITIFSCLVVRPQYRRHGPREVGRCQLADAMSRVCDDHESLITSTRNGQPRGAQRSRHTRKNCALTAVLVADQSSTATKPFHPVAM